MRKIYLLLLAVLFAVTGGMAQAVNLYGFATGTGGALDAMTGSTQLVGASSDDGASALTTIPFTFNYGGTNYTSFGAGANGVLRLGAVTSTTSTYYTNSSANAGTGAPLIMPYWDDLATGVGGKVHYVVTGATPNRILKIEWFVTVPRNTLGNANAKFQCWIYETSNIVQFVYGSGMLANTANSGATIGISSSATVYNNVNTDLTTNSTSTFVTAIVNPITSGTTYTFTPPPPCSGTPVAGTHPTTLFTLCPTATAVLTVTGQTSGVTGLTYQWEQADDAAFTTNVANAVGGTGATTLSYTTPAYVSGTLYYRLKITCTNGGAFATTTTPVQVTGPAAPTTQASAITIPTIGTTTATINWTNGNGNNRVVYLNSTNTFTDPTGPASPGTAATAWANAGQQLIYDGTAATVNVTALTPGANYYVRVYENNKCTGPAYYYNVAAATSNPNSFATFLTLEHNVTRTTNISYTPITGTGLTGFGSSDDGASALTNIGFPFVYKGQTFTQFSASTNGVVKLGAVAATSFNGSIESTHNNTICAFWDDLVVQGNPAATLVGNFIKYETSGSTPNRITTIQWVGMEQFNYGGPDINFQVKLYETSNNIEILHGNMTIYTGTAPTVAGQIYPTLLKYKIGLSGPTSGTGLVRGMAQLAENIVAFGPTDPANMAIAPECNVSYLFTPAVYTGATTAPAATPPANDNSATATTLTVNAVPCVNLCGTYYTTKNATASVEATSCTPAPDDDVWFKFTATATGATISVKGGIGFDAVVSLKDASFVDVTGFGCVDATTGVTPQWGLTETLNPTTLVPGNVYYVRVSHKGAGSGSASGFSICINEVLIPPANDNPCGAQSLTVGASCVPYSDNTLPSKTSFFGASTTTSNGVVAPTCTGVGATPQDIWFSFVAPAGGIAIINVTPVSGVNPAIEIDSVFSGTCGASNLILGSKTAWCFNNVGSGLAEDITVSNLIAGNTYYLRVYQHPSGNGGAPVSNSQFSICVSYPPAPVCTTNSSPADAATNVSITPTLTWAAAPNATSYDVYIGTPDLAAAQAATPVNVTTTSYTVPTALAFGTVYYWFVVPKNATGMPTGCTGTTFTTNVCSNPTATYTAQRIGTCPGATQFEVVVNVTSLGNAASIDITNDGGAPTISGVTTTGNVTVGPFALGTSVLITLDHPIGATCDVVSPSQTFAVCPPPPPANDNICNAITLVLDGASDCQNTTTATVESAEPATVVGTCGSAANNTVWYKYTPSVTGPVQIVMESATGTTFGSGFWFTVNTVTGCPTPVLTNVVPCGNSFAVGAAGSKDSISVNLIAGTEYYIQIDGVSGDYGAFCIKLKTPSIAPGTPNACYGSAASVTINTANGNNNVWVPITDADGNRILDINANGNDLGATTFNMYKNANAVRQNIGTYYLDRNFTITPTTQPSSNVDIRLYFTEAERLALETAQAGSSPLTAGNINCTKNSQVCGPTYTPNLTGEVLLTPSIIGTYGANGYYNTYSVASFSTFFLHVGTSVLSVSLTNVKADITGATNTVSWTTVTESNNRKFVVERSLNGSSFAPIGEVATRATGGNSSVALNYNFVDANPVQGKQYYRLQMVDNGGRTTYSQIVTLRRGGGKLEIVDVRPNPTTGTVYFNVLGANANVNVAVRDLSGKEVIRKGLVQSNGFSLDMSSLANGLYILEATDVRTSEKALFKVVKQ
jgi:hypothetical protein